MPPPQFGVIEQQVRHRVHRVPPLSGVDVLGKNRHQHQVPYGRQTLAPFA